MVTKLNQLRVDKEEYIPSKKRKGGSSIASGHSEVSFFSRTFVSTCIRVSR